MGRQGSLGSSQAFCLTGESEAKVDRNTGARCSASELSDLPRDVLTPRELNLTENYGITDLLALLRERKLTVEEVTRAFLRRAALAHAAVRRELTLALSHRLADMYRPTASSNFSGIRPLSGPSTSTLCHSRWERSLDCQFPQRSIWAWSEIMSNRQRLL